MSAGYSTGYGGHPRHQQYAPNYATNPNESYTGGLTEEEQVEAAIRNSLYDRGKAFETSFLMKFHLMHCTYFQSNMRLLVSVGQHNHRGAPPPYGFYSPEEAIAEEIRQRRLRRFDS